MSKRTHIYPIIILLLFNLSGCVTAPLHIEDKYIFTGLEQVDSFSNRNLMGWEIVDRQSLIVQTAPSTYYLLILSHRMRDLNVAETILLSSTGTRVEAGIDCVEAIGPLCDGSVPATIHNIYKLKGNDEVKYVKSKIRE